MSEGIAAESGVLTPEFMSKLEALSILAKKVQLGSTKGERRSKRKGSSVEFADYRPYVQGDDLRHVDWNVYGRTDALYLKLFMEQEDVTVHLLIDSSASMRFGKPSKIAFAQQLAAAIGYVALVNYDRVSAEAFSGEGGRRLRPCRGKSSARSLFEFVSSISCGGTTDLERNCRSYFVRNRSRGVAVLISDFFDENGHESALRRLMQSGSDLYAVHVLAPEEVHPPITGDLKLIDSESSAFTEISMSRALLKRYKANLDGFCESIKRFCLARGITYIPAVTDTSIERLTLDVLRKRGMIR